MSETKRHQGRFMRRGMHLANQFYFGEIDRKEFDKAWKRLGDQIENELKNK